LSIFAANFYTFIPTFYVPSGPMRNCLFVLIALIRFSPLYAQDQLGIPQIENFSNEIYHAGIQNWCVKQDQAGNLFVGNNEGLLFYNGGYWNLFKLPNNTSVRSIGIDSKNRIYIGAQDEIGYFFPDAQGVLKYKSLLSLVPLKFRKFADVWDIAVLNDEVFFRAKTVILHYKGGVINTYKPNLSWEFVGQVNGHIYAHSRDGGLMVYDKEIWKPVCSDLVLKQSAITGILPYDKDTLLVSTLKNGMFLLYKNKLIPKKTDLDSTFLNERMYLTTVLDHGRYAVGTTSGGVYIMNKAGRLLQKYSFHEGLQNNNVRGILLDQHKNMWLALDDGISFVAINSAIKNIFPDRNKQVTSYAFKIYDQSLYIGTSNGLYASALAAGSQDLSFARSAFKEVKNTKGQVWSLDEINGQLLMGHEDGSFIVSKGMANKIPGTPGTWAFQPMNNIFPAKDVIGGTYLGLQKLEYDQGSFKYSSVSGVTESLRFLVTDNSNNLWSSHPYHGVYKIELSPDHRSVRHIRLYTAKDGLPETLYNYVYRIKNRVLIATSRGIYEYKEKTNTFVRFALLNNALSTLPVQYLKEDEEGNVWFITNKRVGVIDFTHPSAGNPYTVVYLPEMDGKVVGGFESIYPLDKNNIFIGANKGAFLINYENYRANIVKPAAAIGTVRLTGSQDSVIFGGYFVQDGRISRTQDQARTLSFSHNLNSFHFEFASTLFEQKRNVSFSYQLVGFDKEWSPWSAKSEKDYTNLPAGNYTFKVKARTNKGNESEPVSYTFKVLPAWYNTIWMGLFYVTVVLVVLLGIVKWQKRKHIMESTRLSYLHQLELDRTEKEIVRLKNERLEADVNHKNKELSTMTMHLVQRNKVLAKIKEVISTVIKNDDIPDGSASFRHLVRLIREVERDGQDMEQLTMHFNNVNYEFFNKLKDRFPELSPNDLKFCAYLRMNLSSKEMSQLMNVTIKAVEVGRYRLRKKLHLQPETNLYEFLTEISRDKAPNLS
jgi:ligand-binding sensor domain-containing protein